MATRSHSNHPGGDPATLVTGAGLTTSVHAVELLKSDHRLVEDWLGQFQGTEDAARRESLAARICKALEVHAQIEEEIFYPAFLDAGGNASLHHQSIIEHEASRALIMKIRHSPGAASDDFFDARLKVLGEMFRHHVEDEERAGGLFDQAEAIGMDLDLLGPRLEQRKVQLMDDAWTDAGYDAAVGMPGEVQSVSPGLADPDLRGGTQRR